MVKIFLKGLLKYWLVSFLTNIIILFIALFVVGLKNYVPLLNINCIFWALYFSLKSVKEMNKLKEEKKNDSDRID